MALPDVATAVVTAAAEPSELRRDAEDVEEMLEIEAGSVLKLLKNSSQELINLKKKQGTPQTKNLFQALGLV